MPHLTTERPRRRRGRFLLIALVAALATALAWPTPTPVEAQGRVVIGTIEVKQLEALSKLAEVRRIDPSL